MGRRRLARLLEPRALVRLPRRAQVQQQEVAQPRLVRLLVERLLLVRLLLVAPPRAQVEPPPAPLVWLDLSGHA